MLIYLQRYPRLKRLFNPISNIVFLEMSFIAKKFTSLLAYEKTIKGIERAIIISTITSKMKCFINDKSPISSSSTGLAQYKHTSIAISSTNTYLHSHFKHKHTYSNFSTNNQTPYHTITSTSNYSSKLETTSNNDEVNGKGGYYNFPTKYAFVS